MAIGHTGDKQRKVYVSADAMSCLVLIADMFRSNYLYFKVLQKHRFYPVKAVLLLSESGAFGG